VRVKLLAQDAELYVFTESRDRVAKERSMRWRQLKWLCARLRQLSSMKLTREALLMKFGATQSKAPAAWRLVTLKLPAAGASFGYGRNRKKLREIRRGEGRYLLRTNLTKSDPAKLWEYYLQLVPFEEAFKTQGRSGHPSNISPTRAFFRGLLSRKSMPCPGATRRIREERLGPRRSFVLY
jgi:hypothetical protein